MLQIYPCYFFSAGANFWAIWVIFGPFWQFRVIFGPFWQFRVIFGPIWAILGNFRSFLGHFLVLFFVAKYASVLFKSLFATLGKYHFGNEDCKDDQVGDDVVLCPEAR